VLFSLDVIRALQQEGHPIAAGTAGENFTISGVEWAALAPGHRLQVGPVQLLLTRYTSPCRKIGGSFLNREFTRIDHGDHPGWSRLCARVIEGGLVRPGDPVMLLE
jgi:MOSC domain-containing protein YiiM